MWALQKLRQLMTSQIGSDIKVNALLASPTGDALEPEPSRGYSMVSGPWTYLYHDLVGMTCVQSTPKYTQEIRTLDNHFLKLWLSRNQSVNLGRIPPGVLAISKGGWRDL